MNEPGTSSLMASVKAPEAPAMAQITDQLVSARGRVHDLALQLQRTADLVFGERPESADVANTEPASVYSGAVGAAMDNLCDLDRSIDFLAEQVNRLSRLA